MQRNPISGVCKLGLFIGLLLLASAFLSTTSIRVEGQAGPSEPAIKVASPPTSALAGTKVTIAWEVAGAGKIVHTAVHYDTKQGNPADYKSYAKATPDFAALNPAQDAPKKYNATIDIPSSGTVYYVVHAIVDGKDVYNPDGEKTLGVIPLPGGGLIQRPPGLGAAQPPPAGAPDVGAYGGGGDSNVLLGIGVIVIIVVVALVARSRMKKSQNNYGPPPGA